VTAAFPVPPVGLPCSRQAADLQFTSHEATGLQLTLQQMLRNISLPSGA
jgi:hypothetical protein